MIEIYHVQGTRGIRPIWVCEELGLTYRVVTVDFSAAYRASPEWRRMNPVGKVPVLVDGDLTLFESGAMVQYLLDRYGEGRLQPPAGTREHALYLQWSWFAEATFARPLGEIVNHRRVFSEKQQNPAAIDEMAERTWLCVDALERALTGRDWLVGDDITGADIMTGYTLMLVTRLTPGELPPSVARYYAALSARPGFQVAVAAGRT
ncbi:MAG TPA: glutathione S-transferase family protein [Pseudomonadales bacterium]